MNGLTTGKGTDYVSIVLTVMAIGQTLPAETQKWFIPLCLGILAVLFKMIRGDQHNKSEGVDESQPPEDVVKDGRA